MPADPPHTIIIWGLGREGKSSYQYLRQQYPEANFLLTDDQVLAQLDPAWRQILDQDELATFQPTPELTPAQLSSILNKTSAQVMVVKTAGMPPRHPFHQILAQFDSIITSNTQLFFDFARDNQVKTIGVTGTKGKSTTAALIYHTLSLATLPVVFGGNIGTPPLDMVTELQTHIDAGGQPIAVLELSSHQLANLKTSPHIAVIQNITPEHLDYYASFEQYAQAKQAVARYQTPDDLVIFNSHYALPRQLAQSGQAKQLTFSINASTPSKTDVAHVANDTIYYRNQPIIRCDQVTLLGAHNLDNILPTVIVAKQMAIADSDIVRSLTSFQPLPHRLELVAEIDGVKYINDSLSTTPVATIAALQTFSDQPVILIAGGYDRGLDYGGLAEFLSTYPVQALILFQPSGQRIKDLLTSVKFPIEFADDMAQAVTLAKKYARAGSVVLLSPGSASFGQFKDYATRGQAFAEAVKQNMTKQYFSLYLEPNGSARQLLEEIIAQLAQEFGGPIFAPHLTLIPNRYGTLAEITQITQTIAQQIALPLELCLDQVGTGQTRYQCVFLKVQTTPELTSASQIARQVFVATDLPVITPHLSLFYADISNQPADETTRQLIARRAKELLSGHLPLHFTCSNITVHTDGDDVSSWHQVAQVTKT